MKKLSRIFTSVAIMLVGLLALNLIAPHVFADAKSAVCEGAGLAVGEKNDNGCATPAGTPEVDSVVQRGLNIFSAILGIISVIMIMIGGLKFMTSQGDSGQMNSARNTIIFAAVGLVIVTLAQVLVKFVLNKFTT